MFPTMQKVYERLEKNKDNLALRALYAIERVSKGNGVRLQRLRRLRAA